MSRRRPMLIAAAVALAVLVGLVLFSRSGPDREPYRPSSVGPAGLQGLVRLLEGAGVDVDESGFPDADTDVAVVVLDAADAETDAALLDWVADGGRLIVLDPASRLLPDPAGVRVGSGRPGDDGSRNVAVAVDCGGAAPLSSVLADVRAVAAEAVVLFEPDDRWAACADADGVAAVVARAEGAGAVVGVGGPDVFVNDNLAEADNAVLAQALLAPVPGERLVFVPEIGLLGGDRTLWSLVGERIRWSLVMVGLAVVALVWWRARRLGRPIEDDPPVRVAGSELVVAEGAMLQRSGRVGDVAALLVDDLTGEVRSRLGLGPAADVDDLAAIVAARTGRDRAQVARLLTAPDVADDAGLVRFVAALDDLRHDLFESPAPGATTTRSPIPHEVLP